MDGATTTPLKTLYTYRLNRLERARTVTTGAVDQDCNIASGGGTQTDDYQYTYDKASNRLTSAHSASTTSFTYDVANQLSLKNPPTGQSTTYSYDANGNLTGDSRSLALAYNQWNQTTSLRPEGNNQTTTPFKYAGENQYQRTEKGSILYLNGLAGLLNERAGGTTTYFIRDNSGGLVGLRRGGQSYYYLTDAIGSIAKVTGTGGTVVAGYTYDPYGDVVSSTGTLSQPYRFAGEYWDAESRYYKIGMRYYDPALGRWTQKDPVTGYVDPRQANGYIYAGDDPVNRVDPSGQLFDEIWEGVKSGVKKARWGAKWVGRASGLGTFAYTGLYCFRDAVWAAGGFEGETGADDCDPVANYLGGSEPAY